jgi:hypothetical protein
MQDGKPFLEDFAKPSQVELLIWGRVAHTLAMQASSGEFNLLSIAVNVEALLKLPNLGAHP